MPKWGVTLNCGWALRSQGWNGNHYQVVHLRGLRWAPSSSAGLRCVSAHTFSPVHSGWHLALQVTGHYPEKPSACYSTKSILKSIQAKRSKKQRIPITHLRRLQFLLERWTWNGLAAGLGIAWCPLPEAEAAKPHTGGEAQQLLTANTADQVWLWAVCCAAFVLSFRSRRSLLPTALGRGTGIIFFYLTFFSWRSSRKCKTFS